MFGCLDAAAPQITSLPASAYGSQPRLFTRTYKRLSLRGHGRTECVSLKESSQVNASNEITPVEVVEQRILLIRGLKVILDVDLARFYGVTTRRLNEQVKRNRARFPSDFAFRLTQEEWNEVVAKCDHLGKSKYFKGLPLVFSEHGAIMAAGVLNSSRAVEMSVLVVRAFVNLRHAIAEHEAIARRLDDLERHFTGHDDQIRGILDALRLLASPAPVPERRRIGFEAGSP